ncbi:MAG: tetratricopeptide repeat protein [Spirosomaceae bacterium]|nr:tetratricopeptide repeat protein [Spirosomataceae bacterium]
MNTIKSALFTVFLILSISAFSQEVDLARAYFEKGEFEKSYDLFKNLSKDESAANNIHKEYIATMYRLKKYDEAEKFIKKQIKNNSEMIVYKADYIELMKLTNENPEKIIKAQSDLLNEAIQIDVNVYALQDYYYKINDYDTLIKLLETAKQADKSQSKFAIQLARAYLYNGEKYKMLEEVLNYGLMNQNTAYVQQTIQDNFREEEEFEQLESIFYQKIQENPNIVYYNDLLTWHFIQRKNFRKAFAQARAVDRRLRLEGQKVFEIASIAFQNRDFKTASTMYEYVMKEYPNGEYYPYARRWLIQSKEEIVKTTYPIDLKDIKDLIAEYEQMFREVGNTNKTLEAARNVALLKAFYLDEHDEAIKILEDAVSRAGSNQNFKDECKIDMGDIYILKNEPWESTLLYLQVEKSQKEDKLGEIAKLRGAKNYYYKGDFELAKEVLDILKKATTREIANDAMQLSLLIQDNTGMDTSTVAMEDFAKVDLLVFQNKNEEALAELNVMLEKYKKHYLADEILLLRAKTKLKMNQIEEGMADLNLLITDYSVDILADDALFLLATLTEEVKSDKAEAMKLYRKLLADYPGSIFGVEARKRYRLLRGDFVN